MIVAKKVIGLRFLFFFSVLRSQLLVAKKVSALSARLVYASILGLSIIEIETQKKLSNRLSIPRFFGLMNSSTSSLMGYCSLFKCLFPIIIIRC